MRNVCKACGKTIGRVYPGGLCQGCYKYFLNGGAIYEKPAPGVVAKDENGRVICHICGRSFTRLGSHVRESHEMTISEYKEAFGLCRSARTTETTYSEKMRESAYINNMPERLAMVGVQTRIKPGEKLREGIRGRTQETIYKMNRRNTK